MNAVIEALLCLRFTVLTDERTKNTSTGRKHLDSFLAEKANISSISLPLGENEDISMIFSSSLQSEYNVYSDTQAEASLEFLALKQLVIIYLKFKCLFMPQKILRPRGMAEWCCLLMRF